MAYCPLCGYESGALVNTPEGWMCPRCRDFGPDRSATKTSLNTIDCKTWEKRCHYTMHCPTRLEDMADAVRHLKCYCGDWATLTKCQVTRADDIYCLTMEGKDGFTIPDFEVEDIVDRLIDADFQPRVIDSMHIVATDILGKQDDSDKMVIICANRGTDYLTLAQAIEKYGISRENDANDCRRFARCPSLNGLIGPMYPNHGFIARYEDQAVYDALSS